MVLFIVALVVYVQCSQSLVIIGAGVPTPADGVRRYSSLDILLMEEILHQLGCIEACE